MPGLRVPEPEAPQHAPLEGAAPRQEYRRLAGPWRGPKAKSEKSRAKLPPIDGKASLTVMMALQSGLIREADMLKHLT